MHLSHMGCKNTTNHNLKNFSMSFIDGVFSKILPNNYSPPESEKIIQA